MRNKLRHYLLKGNDMEPSKLPNWPAAMRRELAAAYVGLSPSSFDRAVKEGVLPKPVIVYGSTKVWLQNELLQCLEQKQQPENEGWGNVGQVKISSKKTKPQRHVPLVLGAAWPPNPPAPR